MSSGPTRPRTTKKIIVEINPSFGREKNANNDIQARSSSQEYICDQNYNQSF